MLYLLEHSSNSLSYAVMLSNHSMVDIKNNFASIADFSLQVKSALHAHCKLVGSLTRICNLKRKASILGADSGFIYYPFSSIN